MTDELRFRPLQAADLDALYAVELASFSQPWSREAYAHELTENALARYFGCFAGGALVAFAGCWLIVDEAHITNVAVAPAWRRRGLGEWMLRRLFVSLQAAGAASFTLEVRAANQPAIRLYQKLGFRCCGRRRGYYDDPPDDALILWRGGTQQQQEEE